MTIEGRSEPGTTYDSNQNTIVYLSGKPARDYQRFLNENKAFTPDSTLPPCGMEAYNTYEKTKKRRGR